MQGVFELLHGGEFKAMHFLHHFLANADLPNVRGGEAVGALGFLIFVDGQMDPPSVGKFDIEGGVRLALRKHSSQMEDAIENCRGDGSAIV